MVLIFLYESKLVNSCSRKSGYGCEELRKKFFSFLNQTFHKIFLTFFQKKKKFINKKSDDQPNNAKNLLKIVISK